MLIPTENEQVRQVAENFPEATKRFRYCGPSWDQFRLLYDKRLTYDWAAANGICIPQTIALGATPDLSERATFPLIVKPAVKRTYSQYSRKKAIRVASPSELKELLLESLRSVPVGDLLCQEIIPGDGRYQWSYAGFFLDGQPIAAFTACRRRQHPPDFGRASTYVVADFDEEVESESRKVLAMLRYSGLAEVEWKRDPRDGKLKLLEINARSWGWHSLATRVVGNLPRMLYDYLVEGVANPTEARYGSRWMKWITDVPVAAHLLRRRELTWPEYLRAVRESDVWCEWDRGDPLPFVLQGLLVPYLWLKRGY